MRLGIDILLDENRSKLLGRRVGLLTNSACVDSKGRPTLDRVLSDDEIDLRAIFAPEHGINLSAQDMEPVPSESEQRRKVPVHSLYGNSVESLVPTDEALSSIDLMLIDLQDIGSRYYTYVWTAALCAKGCSRRGRKIILCDRPNPIGGISTEGGGIEPGFESFVGLYSVPNRHGMTIAEIVHYVNNNEHIGANMDIIKMDGWQRQMLWNDTGLSWHNPSPNMRSLAAALLYPGMCLIEATNLSEGRGTDEPFILVGAPFISADKISSEFNALSLPGIIAEPASFTPNRQKWRGERCEGVRWKIIDRNTFRPYLTGLVFIWLVKKLYGGRGFEWRKDPYEFVSDIPAIDLLTGSAQFRKKIDNTSMEDLLKLSETPQEFADRISGYLLY